MLLLPPLKAKKYEIKSNKTPLEAYKILKSMTKSAATSFDTCDFIGDIGFPDFQIRPHFPFIKDSVSPILHGKISKSEEKAKIIIEVSTFLAIPVILCYSVPPYQDPAPLGLFQILLFKFWLIMESFELLKT